MNKITKPIFVSYYPIGVCDTPYIQYKGEFKNLDIEQLYHHAIPIILKTINEFNFSEIYNELINFFDVEINDLLKNKEHFISNCKGYCEILLVKSFLDCFVVKSDKCTNDTKGFYGTCYMKFLNESDSKLAHNKDATEFYDFSFELHFSIDSIININDD